MSACGCGGGGRVDGYRLPESIVPNPPAPATAQARSAGVGRHGWPWWMWAALGVVVFFVWRRR